MTHNSLPDPSASTQDVHGEEEDVFALPASSAQNRLWFLEQWESGDYNIFIAVGMKGYLDSEALQRALQECIRRHEALRTVFKSVDGELLQIILQQVPFALSMIDLRQFSRDIQSGKIRRLFREDFRRPFDLEQGPLLRATVLLIREGVAILMLSMHHIISDGWSMEVLFQEVKTLYTAYVLDQPSPLPELSLQYADYTIWQNGWLQGAEMREQMEYWKQQLADITPLQLPMDRPHLASQSFRGSSQFAIFPATIAQPLRALSRRAGATLFMTLLTALNILLYRYTNQDDLVVGTLIAGRNERQLESLIGCFINTLGLRTNLAGNPTFREALERVRQVTLDAYNHQDLPFERLMDELQLERGLSHNPLTQVMFVLQNVPREEVNLPGLVLMPLKLDGETSMLLGNTNAARLTTYQNTTPESNTLISDLDLTVWESGNELIWEIKYNVDYFDLTTIKRLQIHYQTLLESIIANPDQHIADLPLISPTEKQQLLVDWNATALTYPRAQCFHTLFEEQAARTPNAVAARCSGERVSYQELNQRANQLASILRAQGVGPEVLVALLEVRGLAFLTALLAIWKAGGAYLPLDPEHPPARLRQVVSSSGCSLLLTTRPFESLVENALHALPTEQRPALLWLDAALPAEASTENLPTLITPRHLAYVIYTSGSTGQPKGAMLEHGGMLNHLYAKIADLGLTASDIVAQTATQCFDISLWQFLAALLVGGCVQIYPDEIAHDPARLLERIEQQQVSIWETVPSLLRLLLESIEPQRQMRPALTHLRWLVPTGEALPTELCARWLALYPTVPLLNAYGPTECSDDVTHHAITAPLSETEATMPIGKAVANTRLYLLDRHLCLLPPGIKGEIYVGGAGVGRGYLGDARRTAERFFPDPFSSELGARLYRTGDLARYRPDGSLEFFGRGDHQVKLRGFRIELGEIEAALKKHPAVRDCVVVVREDTPGNQRLAAYVVLAEDLSSAELQQFVREQLPEYMVPSFLLPLDALPLSPSGKVNRHALPAPAESAATRGIEYIAPRTQLERDLAAIWATVLDVERVGLLDDFFDLGGHSLLIMRLVSLVEQQFHQRLPLAAIFNYRTVEAMAELLQRYLTPSLWTPDAQMHLPEIDLQREAILTTEDCPEVWSGELNLTPATILLTGATGFIGTFLLAELLTQTSAHISCLVRAATAEEGMQRLRNALTEAQLWREEFQARITPLPGDLGRAALGLTPTHFEQLCQEIETIYHCGAEVNMIYPYEALKAVNVQGTREILRLASHGRIKPLHYISTLSVFAHYRVNEDQLISEQEALDQHREHLLGGYAQSKWVAEKMVMLARSRGLPVAIYRLGRVTGHSQSGAWRTEDVLRRMICGCIQLGSIPEIMLNDEMELTPVDYVCSAIVALAKRRLSLGQSFHLCNQQTTQVREMVNWVSEFGYSVRQVSYAQWLDTLAALPAEQAHNALTDIAALFPPQEQVAAEQRTQRKPRMIYEEKNTRNGLRISGIACPTVDARLLHAYLACMVRQGQLPDPLQV